jgi:hypothetical protein
MATQASEAREHAQRFIYERPPLYPKQRRAIFDCPDVNGRKARYGLIEASTKAGKTVGCLAWILEQALAGKAGDNYWWVAPIFMQSMIAYRRLKRGLPTTLYVVNERDLSLTLPNGAMIWFKSADNADSLYGDDVKAVVVDEASRVKDEAWFAIRTTLTATRGVVRIIGNVKGRKNWFYSMCRKAEAGEPNMAYAKLTAYDAVEGGVLDAEEIEDAKRQLPENVFKELYLAEPSDDGGNPFGLSHIRACVRPEYSKDTMRVAGIDLAKSVDWTVVIGLDIAGNATGMERWQHEPWDRTQERIITLVERTPALVDSTGVGDPIYERLHKERRNIDGFTFSQASKQRLMEGLAVAIQSHKVSFPDGPIRAELDQFEYVYSRKGVSYSAPEGYHDDCVVALALAVEKLRLISPALLHGVGASDMPRISPWLGATSEHSEA